VTPAPAQLDLPRALDCARRAALDAWSAISHFHGGKFEVEEKSDGPSTSADKMADRLIVANLQREYPPERFGYLTEEFLRDPIRLERPAVWIIDPIDGTSDFIKGSGDFAIHIGLVVPGAKGFEPAVSVVYHPLAGHLFTAIRGGGAFVEREERSGEPGAARWWSRPAAAPPRPWQEARFAAPQPLRVTAHSDIEKMTAVYSASHQTRRLKRMLELVPFARSYARGSVGVKLGEIALGRADVYVNTERGICKEWDLCAPHLILEEAGGRVTTLEGDPVFYNQSEVRLLAGILASNGANHPALVELISPLTR